MPIHQLNERAQKGAQTMKLQADIVYIVNTNTRIIHRVDCYHVEQMSEKNKSRRYYSLSAARKACPNGRLCLHCLGNTKPNAAARLGRGFCAKNKRLASPARRFCFINCRSDRQGRPTSVLFYVRPTSDTQTALFEGPHLISLGHTDTVYH